MKYVLTQEELDELQNKADVEVESADKLNANRLRNILENTRRLIINKAQDQREYKVNEVFNISFTAENLDEEFLSLLRAMETTF